MLTCLGCLRSSWIVDSDWWDSLTSWLSPCPGHCFLCQQAAAVLGLAAGQPGAAFLCRAGHKYIQIILTHYNYHSSLLAFSLGKSSQYREQEKCFVSFFVLSAHSSLTSFYSHSQLTSLGMHLPSSSHNLSKGGEWNNSRPLYYFPLSVLLIVGRNILLEYKWTWWHLSPSGEAILMMLEVTPAPQYLTHHPSSSPLHHTL